MDYYRRTYGDAAVIIASDGTVVKDNGEWKRLNDEVESLRGFRYEADEVVAERERTDNERALREFAEERSRRESVEEQLADARNVVKSQSKALRDYERTYGPLPSAVSASLDEQDMDFKHGKRTPDINAPEVERFWMSRKALIDALERAQSTFDSDFAAGAHAIEILDRLAEELRK